jgi:acyl-CoA synthetase (AMP-forming)/AMP-acid ligase II
VPCPLALGGNKVNVGNILRFNRRNYPYKEALVRGGVRLTYRQLNDRVNSLANALSKLGVRKGHNVAIMLQNCSEYIEIYFALAKLGAVAVPLNFMYKGMGLKFLMDNAYVKMVFIEDRTKEEVEKIRGDLKTIQSLGSVFIGANTPAGYLCYEELATAHSKEEPDVTVGEDDDLLILYSSGTTGLPKGIVLTHKTRLTYYHWCGLQYGIRFQDVHLVNTPLYHNMASFLSFSQFYTGGKVVVMRKFDPGETLATIEREKVTGMFMVPTQYNLIMELPDKERYEVGSLKWLLSAGSPLLTSTKRFILNFFKCELYDMYGLTETGPFTNMNHHLEPAKVRCVGLPFFHMEMRVVDEQGKDLPYCEIGEIVARGPLLLRTYYKNEKAYKDAMRDGWFYTGDLGKVDQDGYLYLVDRKKDMICSGGVNIYPSDIEVILNSHPKILESAVIGVPDRKWGEAVKAVVVLREGKQMSKEEVIQYCKSNLAGYQVPKSVDFVLSLPRNPSGKVLKKELRAPYWEGQEGKI